MAIVPGIVYVVLLGQSYAVYRALPVCLCARTCPVLSTSAASVAECLCIRCPVGTVRGSIVTYRRAGTSFLRLCFASLNEKLYREENLFCHFRSAFPTIGVPNEAKRERERKREDSVAVSTPEGCSLHFRLACGRYGLPPGGTMQCYRFYGAFCFLGRPEPWELPEVLKFSISLERSFNTVAILGRVK